MATSQQLKVDNMPLTFSLKAVVYPWEYWNKVLVTGCSSWSHEKEIYNYIPTNSNCCYKMSTHL